MKKHTVHVTRTSPALEGPCHVAAQPGTPLTSRLASRAERINLVDENDGRRGRKPPSLPPFLIFPLRPLPRPPPVSPALLTSTLRSTVTVALFTSPLALLGALLLLLVLLPAACALLGVLSPFQPGWPGPGLAPGCCGGLGEHPAQAPLALARVRPADEERAAGGSTREGKATGMQGLCTVRSCSLEGVYHPHIEDALQGSNGKGVRGLWTALGVPWLYHPTG